MRASEYTLSLYAEMENGLSEINLKETATIQISRLASGIILHHISRLKAFVHNYKFSTKTEEINFFKFLKPKFYSKLIYHQKVFNIFSHLPFTTLSEINNYYVNELREINNYFNANHEFVTYYRSRVNSFDEIYFLRKEPDSWLLMNLEDYEPDLNFTTINDHKVSKMGFFIFGGKVSGDKKDATNDKVDGLNANMPGVDTSISKGAIKDKFSAYHQAFKNVTDQSAMAGIDKNGTGLQGTDYESSYSSADRERLEAQRKMDSLNQVLNQGQMNVQSKLAQYNRSGGFGGSDSKSRKNTVECSGDYNTSDDSLLASLLRMQEQQGGRQKENLTTDRNSSENPGSYDAQMRVFHEQMRYMDSMQKGGCAGSEVNKDLGKSRTYSKEFRPAKDTSFKPLSISAGIVGLESEFNTVRNFSADDNYMSAMIDQDLTAILGSRVRIRLLKDMYVGDYLITRGTYIYGVVTGFQKQRINISIAQVLYNNTSLPVKIDLFDIDGNLGLYVPESNFPEFSKEIGTQATQGLSQVSTTDNSNVKMNMLSQLFNTTTTTLSTLIRKDKVFLKYNYIVYLKDNKTSVNN